MPRIINFPGGLNSWMGFAVRWGGYRAFAAMFVENGLNIALPYFTYEWYELVNEDIAPRLIEFVDFSLERVFLEEGQKEGL